MQAQQYGVLSRKNELVSLNRLMLWFVTYVTGSSNNDAR